MPKAATNIASRSPYHNHSTGALADELGRLATEIAELEGRRKAFREEMIRRGVAEAQGALYRATITDAVRWTIDAKAVRSEMGEALVGRPLPAILGHDGCRQGACRLLEARGVGEYRACLRSIPN